MKIQTPDLLYFIVFDWQMRRMEDEILQCRSRKTDCLTPSSFSYYLYEKRLKKNWSQWEFLYTGGNISGWTAMERLIRERIRELLKQDKITAEDEPQNEEVIRMQHLHEKICAGWMIYFSTGLR